MLTLEFYVHQSHSWPKLRAAWGAMANVLLGESAPWAEVDREELSEPNQGPPCTFSQQLTRPGAELSIRVEKGSGNPREGYYPDVTMRMRVTSADGQIEVVSGGTSAPLGSHRIQITGPLSPRTFDAMRAALYDELDEPDEPSRGSLSWARNIEAIREVDPPRARDWIPSRLRGSAPGASAVGSLRPPGRVARSASGLPP
jgi:hypothetical protein